MVKPIEQLTITDDFMFGAVMRNPKLLKPLLENKIPSRTSAGKTLPSRWTTARSR